MILGTSKYIWDKLSSYYNANVIYRQLKIKQGLQVSQIFTVSQYFRLPLNQLFSTIIFIFNQINVSRWHVWSCILVLFFKFVIRKSLNVIVNKDYKKIWAGPFMLSEIMWCMASKIKLRRRKMLHGDNLVL